MLAGPGAVDERWYLALTQWRADTGWLHPAAAVFSWWAGLAVLVAALVAVAGLAWRRQAGPGPWPAVATAGVTAVVATATVLVNSVLVAPAIGRDRPCERWPHAGALLECSTHSMPSDHSLVAGILAAGLWALSWRAGIAAALVAGAVAASRVYVGLHYPSDVLLGLVLGAGLGWYAVRVARQPLAAWLARCRRTDPRHQHPGPGDHRSGHPKPRALERR
ncbi:phosphatase PAP2 family protein [Micrococcus luteus]|uniref:phosphatase PAP2 family protein n=1 Tax=Micrococcus luteus TaxID=1270 RepID=UPI00190FFF81|nr:phosphatase PAP2 family protein [Micrococcus luteus]QQE49454.1 phosphatase PAP2 family protein [Micrococcus luteus]